MTRVHVCRSSCARRRVCHAPVDAVKFRSVTTSVLCGQRQQFSRVLGAAEVALREVAKVVLMVSN